VTFRFPGFRIVALVGVAGFNALLLENAPGLRQISKVSLAFISPDLIIPSYLLFLTLTAAALIPVMLFRWARFLLYGSMMTCITWAFAGASRVPWWFVDQAAASFYDPPDVGAAVTAVLSILSFLAYILFYNLEAYAAAAEKRGLGDDRIRPDLRRLAAAYGAVAVAAGGLGAGLVFVFERVIAPGQFVPTMSGTAWGTWVLILVGLLLGGVFLVLGRGLRTAPIPEAKPAG